MADLGQNFMPSQLDPETLRRRMGSGETLGDALQILSLRLPRVVGAQAIAPDILLNSQGGLGSEMNPTAPSPMASMIADAVIQQVMGSSPQSQAIAPQMPVAPAPVAPAAPLTNTRSLSGVVAREAASPSGRVPVTGAPRPSEGRFPENAPDPRRGYLPPPRVVPVEASEDPPVSTTQPVPFQPNLPEQPTGPTDSLTDLLDVLDRARRSLGGGRYGA